jgi:protein-S-isoprenylcysteine O-methyltransferase Ste14
MRKPGNWSSLVTDQQPDPDYARWKFEQDRQLAERYHDKETDFARGSSQAAVENANIALRTLVLINGGAAVAVLAFLGGIDETKTSELLDDLTLPVVWFAWGVALAALGIGLAYLTNFCITNSIWDRKHNYVHPYVVETPKSQSWSRWATFFQVLAMIAALGSLGCFLTGIYSVRAALVFAS